MSWKQLVARESLWALGCLIVVATLYVTVIANMKGGPHSGWLNVPASAWAVFWDRFLAGRFWIATGAFYGAIQCTRLAIRAVQVARH